MRRYPGLFKAQVLTARKSSALLIRQALEFKPAAVVVTQEGAYREVSDALKGTSVKVLYGQNSLTEVLQWDSVDMVLNALVGFAGLAPTLSALKSGKVLALANKESLVAGGHLVMRLANSGKTTLLPVDSEHSAIFQCLRGEQAVVEKIILTASGGPFFKYDSRKLDTITIDQALDHPTWNMGAKVTVDSATLMNKGLEVIEAYWLFGQPLNRIVVLIHPQSLIHSMVQFLTAASRHRWVFPICDFPYFMPWVIPKGWHFPM